MPNIVYGGYNNTAPSGSITVTDNTTLSGGGTNVAFAVGAFTGTNGLAPFTFTSIEQWRLLAATFAAKTDEISANSITINLSTSEAMVIGSNGGDSITLGNSGRAEVHGNGGNDYIYTGAIGLHTDDLLDGGTGDDVLHGGNGSDTMIGGDGNDTFVVSVNSDVIVEYAGQGNDLVQSYASYYTLASEVENLQLMAGAVSGFGNALANTITGNDGGNFIYSGDGNDTLHGGGGNDDMHGEAGDDTMNGDAGDDYLDGGSGADVMAGGEGNDTYIVDQSGDTVTEAAGGGIDTVISVVSLQLGANVENLVLGNLGTALIGRGNALDNGLTGNSFDNTFHAGGGNDTLIGGEGADRLYGQDGADTLEGDEGNDLLDGGAGIDTMLGGLGDDIYYVRDAGDTVSEVSGEGTDLVRSTISYTLGDNVESLLLLSGATNGTGNALDNDIRGNGVSNVLLGLEGRDTLYGEAGRDTLDGGAGADLLFGGTGFDTLTGGADADRFVFGEGDTARSTTYADVITDFDEAGGDLINLSRIDANTAVGGNQTFAFIGTQGFGHVAGQLRYQVSGGQTWVQMDTDGDAVADYMIKLTGTHTLAADDFVL